MHNNKEKSKERKWVVKAVDTPDSRLAISNIASKLGINPIVAKLLYNRGYTNVEDASSFLRMERELLLNPFDMADIEKGIERIKKAIDANEKITVYGDYDVDGVTSVCTFYLYLKSLGADVNYYIPNRTGEGYGVSQQAIDNIKADGSTLIITVDTGITANEEVEYASSIGVDIVVTDHHECRSELPNAVAVINPHRPDCQYSFKELAGVGVVFKLICAYEEKVKKLSRYDAAYNIITEYADLVAIGTIADVMPIKSENRIIVKYGLSMIENTKRVGLNALIEASTSKPDVKKNDRIKPDKRKKKTKITSSFIGFTLAPRINAAGRVRSATIAVELFLTQDENEANRIAAELCHANKERQAEENKIMQDAFKEIEKLDIETNPVIVLNADTWHHGVIGIVSSRLTEKYSRPSILVSFEGNENPSPSDDDVGKGSGRSIKGLNLVDALCSCSDYLVKFGGHELAAGLSVSRKNLPLFIEKINEYARNTLTDVDLIPSIESDCEIEFSDVNIAFAESLQMLEPHGVGNSIPMFIIRGITINDISGVSSNKHTRFSFGDGYKSLSGMYFSNSPESLDVYVGDKADILFSVDINEWLDRRSVQLIIRDIRPSSSQKDINNEEIKRFNEIKQGASFTADECVLPSREDFAIVYKYIKSSIHLGVNTINHRDMCSKLSSTGSSQKINYIKLKFIILVFKELNILSISEIEDEIYMFELHYSTTKHNLDKSSILRRLRSQLR